MSRVDAEHKLRSQKCPATRETVEKHKHGVCGCCRREAGEHMTQAQWDALIQEASIESRGGRGYVIIKTLP